MFLWTYKITLMSLRHCRHVPVDILNNISVSQTLSPCYYGNTEQHYCQSDIGTMFLWTYRITLVSVRHFCHVPVDVLNNITVSQTLSAYSCWYRSFTNYWCKGGLQWFAISLKFVAQVYVVWLHHLPFFLQWFHIESRPQCCTCFVDWV
jgi:hypothetical protein